MITTVIKITIFRLFSLFWFTCGKRVVKQSFTIFQYLDVSSCAALTDISMHALSQGCPNLVHLDISWCDMITSTGIKSLAEGCRKLQNFIAKGKSEIFHWILGDVARIT